MSTKYKFWDNRKLYFVSYAVVGWIDLFTRNEYREILADSWNYCSQNRGLEIYAWVIMPSHVHLVVGTHGDPLEKIFADMKRHTSRELHKAIKEHPKESRREWLLDYMRKCGEGNSNNGKFQLWRQDNHPLFVDRPEKLQRAINYIHMNPVKSSDVLLPEHWIWSSAEQYRKGRREGRVRLEEVLSSLF